MSPEPSIDDVADHCTTVLDDVGDAVIAEREILETVLTGFLARGHVLLEDVPGTGKTLTARSLAGALGLSFTRIQFTPDLLPADVTGSYVFNEKAHEFEFRPGPIFGNVVLADEINRASPKTQAALLEAMAEGQVSIDGTTHELPEPFFVIATQNPIEQEGTFPLPEAQVDRFIVKTSFGYPSASGELEILNRRAARTDRTPAVSSRLSLPPAALRTAPESVHVDEAVREYIVSLSRASREDPRVKTGVSPRGTQRLFEAARAYAALRGRSYVTPDHVSRIAPAVMAHRLVLTPDARVDNVDKRAVVADVLDSVPVPTVNYASQPSD
ncbi:AAA family ATPase [Halomicroarcula sp. GCM10025817]|uniref:AAA family ATPase n=1 Tax=Haloarcula TaxID=2237 RepID=UPI0023E8520A|nr:MoxR family ATPase [Halomicroarcula sp. SYNS111]